MQPLPNFWYKPRRKCRCFRSSRKKKQEAILQTRKLNEDASKQEAIIEEQREILATKRITRTSNVEALKAGEAEQKAADRQKIAELNLKALQAEAELDDNNAEMNDKLQQLLLP